MRSALRASILLLLALAGSGCWTVRALPEEWTREEALQKLRGHYPQILEVADDHIVVPDWVHGGRRKTLELKYAEITEVRMVPETSWFFIAPFTGFLCGPLWYTMEVRMENGWDVPVIFECRWALNFAPFWLYPNLVLHPYGPGVALDWLRQDARSRTGRDPRLAPK